MLLNSGFYNLQLQETLMSGVIIICNYVNHRNFGHGEPWVKSGIKAQVSLLLYNKRRAATKTNWSGSIWRALKCAVGEWRR